MPSSIQNILLSIGYLEILNSTNKEIIRRGLSTMQKEVAENRAAAKSQDQNSLCVLDWFLAIDVCLT